MPGRNHVNLRRCIVREFKLMFARRNSHWSNSWLARFKKSLSANNSVGPSIGSNCANVARSGGEFRRYKLPRSTIGCHNASKWIAIASR